MIDAQEMTWYHLPEMANDYFNAREAIEDTVNTHSEHVTLKVLRELQRCNAKPTARISELFLKVW